MLLVGLLSWFYFSPPLEAYAQLNVKVFLIAFARNSVLVALYLVRFITAFIRNEPKI